MGYFDALTSNAFKTAPDGRKLFFPWGVLGRGYVLASGASTSGCGDKSRSTWW
jgi:hypothetical protein